MAQRGEDELLEVGEWVGLTALSVAKTPGLVWCSNLDEQAWKVRGKR